jgi:hypothetical protein
VLAGPHELIRLRCQRRMLGSMRQAACWRRRARWTTPGPVEYHASAGVGERLAASPGGARCRRIQTNIV